MLELISHNYWWLQMLRYIGQYVSTCNLYLYTKSTRYPPTGELYPLPVLKEQWNILSINFVVELSRSKGYNIVMVVADLVFKRVHFIPTHTMVTVEGIARLFLYYV